MKTLGDYIRGFYENYIAPSKEVAPNKKEADLLYPKDAMPDRHGDFGTKKLSPQKCRDVAEQCPLLMKGINKKAKDSVRAWCYIDTLNEETSPVKVDLDIIRAFEERSNIKMKWMEAVKASMVYGDGYLLIVFRNDEDTKLEDPPAKEAYPWTVEKLNPEFIVELDYYPKKREYYRRRGIKHFHYVNQNTGEEYWIHPDRLIHIPCDTLPYSDFGNSKVNLLRNIIKSKINVDIACGEILAWFAHGIFDIGIQNCQKADVDYWVEVANQHPGAWIHDKEREEIKTVAPEAIDPKPFYDYLVLNIAAALVMPVHVLTGVQVGRVTGAEVGTGDYYKDIRDDQDLVYTPLLTKLYAWVLKGHNYNLDEKPPKRRWKYKLVWNPIYVDELAEAEILEKRVAAAEKALNGTKGAGGFIDMKEARMILNKGQIKLDLDKKPKQPKPPVPMPKPERPVGKEDDKKKENDAYTMQLDEATKAMIRLRKEIAARERKLGEEILREQEEDAGSSS